MSLFSEPAVTKMTVILDKPADWEPWFQLRREKAVVDDIWKYCDISKPKHELPKLVEPNKPHVSQVKADATQINELRGTELTIYQDLLNDWRQDKAEYNHAKRKMGELILDISRTIATRHLYLINGKDDPYDRLIALRQQLAPSAPTRNRELIIKYRALQERPQNRNLDQWLDDWIHITNQCKEAGLPDTSGHRAQDDFLTVIRTVAPEWAAPAHQDLIRKESTGNDSSIPSIADYIAEFRTYYRRINPRLPSLGTFASLGMRDQPQPHPTELQTPKENQHPSQRSFSKPPCVCGYNHPYKHCWYLVPDHPKRPTSFRPDKTKQEKITEAIKDPELRQKIERALAQNGKAIPKEFFNQATPQQQPIRFDDGKTNARPSQSFATHSSFSVSLSQETHGPPIINRWILDPGSNIHICNSTESGWTKTQNASPQDMIFAGKAKVPIQAWGEVILNVNTPHGPGQIQLTNVALVEGFFTNVVSLARCRAQDIHFDSGRDVIYQHHPSNVICLLQYDDGHWTIDAGKNDRPPREVFTGLAAHRRTYKPTREDRRPISASRVEAHELLGHPSDEALDHLSENVQGIILKQDMKGPQMRDCDTCIQAKMTTQVSRRTPKNQAKRPFYRIAIDLLQLVPTGEACYNGDKYLLHAVCEYSKWHEATTLIQRSLQHVLPALKALINKIQRQYGYTVIVLKIDGERGYGQELYEIAKQTGMKIELRAPDTPAQLGLAEKAGNTIITKARALRIHSNLPKSLSNELAITAAKIANVTPTRSLDWKTPYEIIHGDKPSIAHFAPIGCKAFVLNKKLKVADKLESRTFIGYLVGYDSTNIFRIWLPKNDRVIRVRDVIFKHQSLYRDELHNSKEQIAQEDIDVLHIPPTKEDEIQWNDLLEPQQLLLSVNYNDGSTRDTSLENATLEQHKDVGYLPTPEPSIFENSISPQPEEQDIDPQPEQHDDEQQLQRQLLDEQYVSDDNSSVTSQSQYPTFDTGQNPAENHPDRSQQHPSRSILPKGWVTSNDYIPDRRRNNAPKRTNPEVGSSSNIVTGKRTRTPHHHQAMATYYRTFAAALHPTVPSKLSGDLLKTKLHRDQLPPPPKRWKDLKDHPFGEEFMQAAQTEFNSCWKKSCFATTTIKATTADAEVLPLMWVFTYKFDEDGYLYKFKARICVRGDLQEIWGETYAATLAMKTFRALIAIATAFDLLMFQFDALNAFLNARLPRKIYCRTPEGFKSQYGELLELKRALYGLKEAPLLWYQELSSTLERLGLKPVPGTPCLYTNDQLIVFFYVDDIVVLVHPNNLATFEKFKQQLLNTYDIRALGELSWFLGIRVIRNKSTRTISLIQDSFIEKIASKFNISQKETRYPDVPLKENHLSTTTEDSNPNRTQLYQQLVGSLAYIATSTRPDVARAHSILSQHLQNPGQKHLHAAYHVWRYLIGTKHYAIQASANAKHGITSISVPSKETEPLFFGASDAAFADQPETRRSSQGYIFKLYGLPIDWKATVQRTVTKSTTEAELLSLSLASSEMQWWQRFFQAIRFDLEFTPALWCDNHQTVGIATKTAHKLQTKLKHVDIHQHWVRQEVAEGRLQVEWKPTSQMPADGLTKILPRQKHKSFVQHLGLSDISSALPESHADN